MSLKIPPISNRDLLNQALTHRSYVNENPHAGADNERLEFLGDAVLGFVVGELLYQRYPQMSEAELTRMRSALVDEKQLTKFAQQISLGELMRLGKGAEKDRGRQSPSLLSDTFEAVIGAYYLDAGIEAVRSYLYPLLSATLESIILPSEVNMPKNLVDCKNRLQQWALAQFGQNPQYLITGESGPDHAKVFTAEVRIQGQVYGVGEDRRKQEAQKRAAEDALQNLGLD